MTFKNSLIPVGMLISLLIGYQFPEGGIFFKTYHFVYAFIFIIFLFNGYSIHVGNKVFNTRFWLILLISVFISLIAAPLFIYQILRPLEMDHSIVIGIIVITAMPPTLSSGIVISEIANGDTAWAIFLTIFLSIIGVFILPYTLKYSISFDNSNFPISELFNKLCLVVLVPLGIGYSIKRLSKIKLPKYCSHIPSFCILLTFYTFIANSIETLSLFNLKDLPTIIAITSAIHLTLILIYLIITKVISLNRSQSISTLFVCSQKTLPLAMTVLVIISQDSGLAILPCICFHFFQLFFDSILATFIHKKTTA